MRASRRRESRRQPRKRRSAESSHTIIPEQTDEMIRVWRAIRDAFHDSKAVTIKGRQSN